MKKVIVNYAAILSGLAIAAFGVVAFVLPQGIMIGGTTGIGRILYYFYGIPVSYTCLLYTSGQCQVGIESTVIDMTGPQPMILRPGIITREDFERVLEKPVLLDPTLNRRPEELSLIHI